MTVELQARHFELSPALKEHVETRVGRLDRYLPDIHATTVMLEHAVVRSQGEVFRAEITAWVDQAVLRAEETNADAFTAVDVASERMFRQIEKYKGKRLNRWHGRAETAPLAEDFVDDEGEERETVVRRKRFRVHAMTEAEAAEQIELLGHDFFVFLNGETGHLNVLYRRRDGGLGLLDPVPA